MIRKMGAAVGLLALVSVLPVEQAEAGKLRDFEQKATAPVYVPPPAAPAPAPAPAPQPKAYSTSPADTAFGSGTYPTENSGESFLGDFMAWLIASPFAFLDTDPDFSASPDEEMDGSGKGGRLLRRHVPGEPVLPLVRLDYNRQYVDSNIAAHDLRVEAGYKMLGFFGRTTRYKDDSDGFTLDINQIYGGVRLAGAFPEYIPGLYEIGLGLGWAQLKGNDSHSSGAITIPLKYYPVDWLGFEFRAAWYNPNEKAIGDYDISACIGGRYIHFRGGYRWLKLQGEGHFNNGPYLGAGIFF